MDDHKQLDDELADLTDALLERREMQMKQTTQPLDEVVQQLYQMIQPDSPPSPAFRDKLTQRLNDEWNMAMQQQKPPRRVPTFYMTPRTRLLAAAAALVIVLGALAIYTQSNQPLQGTTPLGTNSGGVIAVVLIASAVVVLILWRRNR